MSSKQFQVRGKVVSVTGDGVTIEVEPMADGSAIGCEVVDDRVRLTFPRSTNDRVASALAQAFGAVALRSQAVLVTVGVAEPPHKKRVGALHPAAGPRKAPPGPPQKPARAVVEESGEEEQEEGTEEEMEEDAEA